MIKFWRPLYHSVAMAIDNGLRERTGETVTVALQNRALSLLPRTHAKETGKMICVCNLNPREVKKAGPLGLTSQPAWLPG